jgi:predicted nicotinamide N-methyase
VGTTCGSYRPNPRPIEHSRAGTTSETKVGNHLRCGNMDNSIEGDNEAQGFIGAGYSSQRAVCGEVKDDGEEGRLWNGIAVHCCIDDEVLRTRIFREAVEDAAIGSRLGIDFMRAQSESLAINVYSKQLSLQQSHIGMLGISGVIWDCGLLMADFLCTYFGEERPRISSLRLDRMLDLGCGTGICGLTALYSKSTSSVVFSDSVVSSILEDNIDDVKEQLRAAGCSSSQDVNTATVQHNWASSEIPHEVMYGHTIVENCCNQDASFVWDCIICSDVLYEHKSHDALMQLLMRLSFRTVFLSYKKRNEQYEQLFFSRLMTWCDVYWVDPSKLHLANVSAKQLTGLYLFIVVKKLSAMT